jgi:ribonuclease J
MAVETSAGWIVYTGDLRLHGKTGHTTRAFVEEAARLKPVALVCEGTNVERGPGPTEDAVFEACLEEVRKAESQFVVADFGARNVERLLTFLEIARLTDRRLVIMDKDAYLLAAMQSVDPAIPTPTSEPRMGVYRRSLREPRTWVENVRTWFRAQVTSGEVHGNPGAFILCMSFFDVTELIDIDPSAGIWIYSSSEPHNEEQQFELWRLHNWLEYFHLTPFGLTESPSPFHASGHISGPELFDLIRSIAPARVVPVHTTAPEKFQIGLGGDFTVTIGGIGTTISL